MNQVAMSFCWHCGGKFPPNASALNAKYVTDGLGYKHRVHQVCYKDALATVTLPTASQRA